MLWWYDNGVMRKLWYDYVTVFWCDDFVMLWWWCYDMTIVWWRDNGVMISIIDVLIKLKTPMLQSLHLLR